MDRHSLRALSDDELLRRLADLLRQSRRTEADLVAHIAEVDERKLYAREASASMFAYCTEVLRLSEAEAYLRIAAGRASLEHPLLLEMLADGRLHLSGIGKLAPHLTPENAGVLLARAAHKTKRQILELIAEVAPREDVRASVRKLAEPQPLGLAEPQHQKLAELQHLKLTEAQPATSGNLCSGASLEPQHHAPAVAECPPPQPAPGRELRPDAVGSRREAPPTVVEPLAPGRYKIQFTASATLKDKLERLQALSPWPQADLAQVIEAAVTEKLARLEAKRFAQTTAPRKTLQETKTAPLTRHIPAAVRRAVHERDMSRCRFVDVQGRRCSERKRLEFHHRHPFGHGGDHSLPNVVLLCRRHNLLMAEQDYGREAVERNRGSGAPARRLLVDTHPE